MMKVGAGRDPLSLKFRCTSCAPPVKVTLRERIRQPERRGKTIGEAIGDGERIYVNCHDVRSQRSALLDLPALALQLGEDHGAMHDDLVRLFRCSKCHRAGREGSKVGFTCIPDYGLR